MTIPPISKGPRISQEEAIRELMLSSFTEEEAKRFLIEPDVERRTAIINQVKKRVKEGN